MQEKSEEADKKIRIIVISIFQEKPLTNQGFFHIIMPEMVEVRYK